MSITKIILSIVNFIVNISSHFRVFISFTHTSGSEKYLSISCKQESILCVS